MQKTSGLSLNMGKWWEAVHIFKSKCQQSWKKFVSDHNTLLKHDIKRFYIFKKFWFKKKNFHSYTLNVAHIFIQLIHDKDKKPQNLAQNSKAIKDGITNSKLFIEVINYNYFNSYWLWLYSIAIEKSIYHTHSSNYNSMPFNLWPWEICSAFHQFIEHNRQVECKKKRNFKTIFTLDIDREFELLFV